MNIYLASRYSRIDEMGGYAKDLESMGHRVTSRWIRGEHRWSSEAQEVEAATSQMPIEGKRFAEDDIGDLYRSDLLIQFTDAPYTSSRGGKHVELGIALGLGIDVVAVGVRENVFHCLDEVKMFENWAKAREFIGGRYGLQMVYTGLQE